MEKLRFVRYVRVAAAGLVLAVVGCSTDSSLDYSGCESSASDLPAITPDVTSPVYDQHTDPDWIVQEHNFRVLKALGGMGGPDDADGEIIYLNDVACMDASGQVVLSKQGVAISQQLAGQP